MPTYSRSLLKISLLTLLIGCFITQTSFADFGDKNKQTINLDNIEELVVTAPNSKRSLKKAREMLSDLLIDKLNQTAVGDDIIECKNENTVINYRNGRNELLRHCATIAAHKARRKVAKAGFLKKCGFPSRDADFHCQPYTHFGKINAINIEQAKNIDERVIKLMKTDPEFQKLLLNAKKLKDEYDRLYE